MRIQNLRAFCDETVHLNDYTCLVRPNGAGKSTVLTALNIFFRETAGSPVDLLNLTDEGFHCKDTSRPITLTMTFGDLLPEAQEDFNHYYRHGKLVVTAKAVWDERWRVTAVKQ